MYDLSDDLPAVAVGHINPCSHSPIHPFAQLTV